jgi:two-component system OmpR family response regulator/two-component system response regulator QseB
MSEVIDIAQILLVDDEKIFAGPFLRHAGKLRLNAHWESTGRSALNYLSGNHNNVALVVLDMDLPDMNGFDVQKAITRLYPHIHIIIITARMLSETDYIVGIELNAKQYLDKGLGLNVLFSHIRQNLQRLNKQTKKRRGKALIYDEGAGQFTFNGNALSLTRAQRIILLTLYNNPNTCISSKTLISRADLVSTALIRTYIFRIRASFRDAGLNNPENLIILETNEGYRYSP